MANLKFYLATGDDRYLSRARVAAERILASKTDDGGESCWRSIDQVYFGLGHGASGIALFLLYLHLATRDQQWLDAGARALDFDVNRAVTGRLGGLAWPYHTAQPSPLLPYWKYGSAGVGTVLLRYQQVAATDRWRTALDGVADFVEGKYAVSVGQCLGLAGIGNFLLDGYQFTGDVRYRQRAERTLAGLRLFTIETRDGVAFPGDTLARLSCDYATGSAGPALFFARLAHGGPSAFMLDKLCGVGDAFAQPGELRATPVGVS
jgi:lantibiotic modifying enzyme